MTKVENHATSENEKEEKESKEASQKEEKEEDSTNSGINTNVNAELETEPSSDSKPPVAKSSEKKITRKKSTKGGGQGKSKDDLAQFDMLSEHEEHEAPIALPENVLPLFLTTKTQELYNCRCNEDVTQDNPFKFIPKADIIEDFRMRAAVCDFQPFKQQILNYPEEEILIKYDSEFKYGQNFLIALTEEAKENLLKPPEEEKTEEEVIEEEDESVFVYVAPEPKEWISQGSEQEIDEGMVISSRRKMKVSIKRIRREFGEPLSFGDRNVGDVKDGAVECSGYEDKTFELDRIELDKSVQAVFQQVTEGTQTTWKYPRNANTQTYPRELTEEEQIKCFESQECGNFINSTALCFHQALQQNEIMNVFYNDWINLGDSDDAFGTKADNHMKEYQSFTDLQFSKDKLITCIQWHPTVKGVVATSVAERLTFDERVDQAARVIMTPSLILIWSFTDPIHPQLILEAPDDIYSFAFNPSDPNHIAGGCYNGQIILWDITAHSDKLKQQRGSRNKKRTVLPGFEDPNALKTPILRYCAVSCIENSHVTPVTDLLWLPDHMQITKMGVPQENASVYSYQLISCAKDNLVLFWDIRAPKLHQIQEEKEVSSLGVPETFKYLDLTWKPLLKVLVQRSEPGGDHAPTKFSIQERQGDRPSMAAAPQIGKDMGTPSSLKISSVKEKTLQNIKTFLYVGTEDGEVVYVDWMPQKDIESGKIQTPRPAYYHAIHDGPVVSLQRSPFFKDVLLSVGGWTLAIWKEGVSSGPILHSAACSVKLSCGIWSPSRPGVFFISKVDGSIDVWDLLDKTHEPTLTQNVSPTAITQIYPYQVTQKQQLIAVGDNAGTLHILEIPWSLRQATPNELNGVANYIAREVKRRAFVVERWNFREKEKRELEADIKRRVGGLAGAMAQPTEDELEHRARMEYEAYLQEENVFLKHLGVVPEETDEI
ncbi:hypothetical protein BsWGS_02828 [Bradybaena similaris]